MSIVDGKHKTIYTYQKCHLTIRSGISDVLFSASSALSDPSAKFLPMSITGSSFRIIPRDKFTPPRSSQILSNPDQARSSKIKRDQIVTAHKSVLLYRKILIRRVHQLLMDIKQPDQMPHCLIISVFA